MDTQWTSYHAAFLHQAANHHSLVWATIDLALYNETFTGQVKLLPCCHYCLDNNHEGRDCQFAPLEEPPLAKQPHPEAVSHPLVQTDHLSVTRGKQCCIFWVSHDDAQGAWALCLIY